MTEHYTPTDEESIIWLEDVSQQPYVRESLLESGFRKRAVRRIGHGRVVGYATLTDSTPGEGDYKPFWRRVFWLAPHDPYPQGAPIEAVPPDSIKPNQPSGHVYR